MFNLRMTMKLHGHLRVPAISTDVIEPATTRLGDWYANLLVHHRRKVVLFASELTLLPVLIAAPAIATLIPRFGDALAKLLVAIGVDEPDARAELGEMESVSFARTANRRVLGSMSDFAWLLDGAPADETLFNAAIRLADAPCSPIGWATPRSATVALFASKSAR